MYMWVGVLAALLGNCSIGIGQALQKYAVDNGQVTSDRDKDDNKKKLKKKVQFITFVSASRLGNPYWLAGVLMCYAGELGGNSAALMTVSPVIVSSFGILSVMISAYVSSRWSTSADFDADTIVAFMWIGVGVVLLLIGSASWATSVWSVNTPAHWMRHMIESAFLRLILAYGVLALVCVWKVTEGQKASMIYWYVATSALFGAITVLSGKSLGLYVASTSTDDSLKLSVSERQLASESSGASILLIVTLLLAAVSQEVFKQQALSRFPIARFQPLFYAAFNVMVVFGTIIIYGVGNTAMSGMMQVFVITLSFMSIARGVMLLEHKSRTTL